MSVPLKHRIRCIVWVLALTPNSQNKSYRATFVNVFVYSCKQNSMLEAFDPQATFQQFIIRHELRTKGSWALLSSFFFIFLFVKQSQWKWRNSRTASDPLIRIIVKCVCMDISLAQPRFIRCRAARSHSLSFSFGRLELKRKIKMFVHQG